MFYTLVIVLVLIVLAGLVYLTSLDGSYQVRRSQLINADIETVFDKVRDFKSWAEWNPWLMHEPQTKLEFSDNCMDEGGFYTWDGQWVGAGLLRHETFDCPHRIDQHLEFTRPFKSVCSVGFEFDRKDGQTEITWVMRGKMPFLFRFMTQKTKDMIAKDYELGLAMLNGRLDSNANRPEIRFEGDVTLAPFHSLCKGFEGAQHEMERAMEFGFPKLEDYIVQTHGIITGSPFTAYHKVNLKTLTFVCDMAIPVAEGIEPGEYELKDLGGGQFYKVCLKGSYEFLGSAWYAAIAHVKMLKLKYDSQRASLEVYENDPRTVSSINELETTLYVAIK